MIPEYQISLEQGFILVTYRGKAEFGVTDKMLREVGQLAAESKTARVLFDMRESDSSSYHISTIRHAENSSALGIDRRFRIALLGAKGDPMLKYFEDVAVNRGFQVMTFVDEAEAMGWLIRAL